MKNQNIQNAEKTCSYWYSGLSLAFLLLLIHVVLFAVVVLVVGCVGVLAQWLVEWRVVIPCYAIRSLSVMVGIIVCMASAISLLSLMVKEVNND